ncbi:MAG: hypothetical protein ACYDCL_18250 [Myxococcales bacterium]
MDRYLSLLFVAACTSFACGNAAPVTNCYPACAAGQICANGQCVIPVSSSSGGSTGGGGSSTGGSSGASSTGCKIDCAGKCAGADDGCGGSCASGSCNGCCDGNHNCQPGTTIQACGVDGNACSSCGIGGACESGLCCTRTGAPTCSTSPTSDGCGGTYPPTCASDAGAVQCCGDACVPTTEVCCGGGACTPGQVCNNGGCCTPQCPLGKCAGASDGCGGSCPNTCDGCCDATATCQLGSATAACGAGGAACTACGAYPAECVSLNGGNQCCTPTCSGKCKGASDGCGGTCPDECAGCCDSNNNCQAGNALNACGNGGVACQNCGTTACASGQCGSCTPGTPRANPCGACATIQQTCDQNGVWQNNVGASCTSYCGSAQCCSTTDDTTCEDGTQNATCGLNGTSCQNCTALNGTTDPADSSTTLTYVCVPPSGYRPGACALAAGVVVSGNCNDPTVGCCNAGSCFNQGTDWYCADHTCGCSCGGNCACN